MDTALFALCMIVLQHQIAHQAVKGGVEYGAAEFHHIAEAIVGLGEGGQRAALAQRYDVSCE